MTPRRRPPPAVWIEGAHPARTGRAATILLGTCALLGVGETRAAAQSDPPSDVRADAEPPAIAVPASANLGARPRRIARKKARKNRAGNGAGGTASKTADKQAQDSDLELELSLEFASAYVFRGHNVFQSENQREQKWVQRPLLIWTVPGTGLSFGYASANQLTGDNLVSNVAAGLGVEQDLFAGYEVARNEVFGLGTELEAVTYPAADGKAAGAAMPLFLAVSVEPRYRHRAYFYVGYLRGLRHGPLDRDHVYLNPRLEKRFELGESFELALQLGAGMKIFQLGIGSVQNNMFDVLATATLYYALNDVLYVGSKVGWAWTNLEPGRDPETGQATNPRFADEYVPFWALVVGAEY